MVVGKLLLKYYSQIITRGVSRECFAKILTGLRRLIEFSIRHWWPYSRSNHTVCSVMDVHIPSQVFSVNFAKKNLEQLFNRTPVKRSCWYLIKFHIRLYVILFIFFCAFFYSKRIWIIDIQNVFSVNLFYQSKQEIDLLNYYLSC